MGEENVGSLIDVTILSYPNEETGHCFWIVGGRLGRNIFLSLEAAGQLVEGMIINYPSTKPERDKILDKTLKEVCESLNIKIDL